MKSVMLKGTKNSQTKMTFPLMTPLTHHAFKCLTT